MKNIDESAKEYASIRNYEHEIQFTLDKEAFKAGVEFAQRWIPVEEELPTEPAKYLVIRDGEIEFCQWKMSCKTNDGYWYDYMGITHWRPIELT